MNHAIPPREELALHLRALGSWLEADPCNRLSPPPPDLPPLAAIRAALPRAEKQYARELSKPRIDRDAHRVYEQWRRVWFEHVTEQVHPWSEHAAYVTAALSIFEDAVVESNRYGTSAPPVRAAFTALRDALADYDRALRAALPMRAVQRATFEGDHLEAAMHAAAANDPCTPSTTLEEAS